MEYTVNRVVRSGLTNDCQLVEGTIQLADYDADLNIVFPGGRRAVLQWRVKGPTFNICFDQPLLPSGFAEGQHTKDNNCPNCGQPDDHMHPDKETDGRCRNCCPMCIQSNEEEAKV